MPEIQLPGQETPCQNGLTNRTYDRISGIMSLSAVSAADAKDFLPVRVGSESPFRAPIRMRGGLTLVPIAKTFEEKTDLFWALVAKVAPSECWIWQGQCIKDQGYGFFFLRKGEFRAHRIAWLLTYGEIPKGLCVCHRCDNPPCVNPNHLFLGTALDNIRDRHSKGRSAAGNASGRRRHPERFTKSRFPLGHTLGQGERNVAAKLKECDVINIRRLYAKGTSQPALARRFNVKQSAISKVVLRRSWRHIP